MTSKLVHYGLEGTFQLVLLGDDGGELAVTPAMRLHDFKFYGTFKGVCSKQLGEAIVHLAIVTWVELLDVLAALEPALEELREILKNADSRCPGPGAGRD